MIVAVSDVTIVANATSVLVKNVISVTVNGKGMVENSKLEEVDISVKVVV